MDCCRHAWTSLILYPCWRQISHGYLLGTLRARIAFSFSWEDFHNPLAWCCRGLFLSFCCNRVILELGSRHPNWLLSPLCYRWPPSRTFSFFLSFFLSFISDDCLGVLVMEACKYLPKELPTRHILRIVVWKVASNVRVQLPDVLPVPTNR